MGGALTNEGDTAFRAPFVEARDPRLVRESLPALRAQTRPAGAHGRAALSAASASASSSLTGSGPRSPSAATSLALHFVLLVVLMSATAVLAMVVSTIVEAVVMAQLTAEGERPIEERSHHGVGVLTVRPEDHLDALARENS